MKRTVLIVTNVDDDLHAAALASELRKRDEPVLCIDPKSIMDGAIAYRLTNNSSLKIQTPNFELNLDNIKSIWYRRPSELPEMDEVHPDYRAVVREEWKAMILGLWELFDASGVTWVSHPANIRRSEAKLRQLEAAKRLGLSVPKTLVTNNKRELVDFFQTCKSKIIMKKLKSHCIAVGDHTALFVARVLESADQLKDSDLSIAPIVFQEYAPKAYDVRLILIGNSCFAVKIYSQTQKETQIDYRAGLEKTQGLAHELYYAPEQIVSTCQRMLIEFGLNFGAFDFVVSENGDHTFLELNPNGQWLWLQLATQAPITDAFCDLLSSDRRPVDPSVIKQYVT